MSDKDLLQQINSSPLLQRRLEQLLLSGAVSSDVIANSALIPLASHRQRLLFILILC